MFLELAREGCRGDLRGVLPRAAVSVERGRVRARASQAGAAAA